MIFLSTAPNENDLEPIFAGLATRAPIPFGDFNWLAAWDDGPCWVWGERKKIGDLVSCVVDTGRLLAQIQRAHENGFKIFFAVVEAQFRPNPQSGMLQTLRGAEGKRPSWVDYHLNPKDRNSTKIEYSRIDNYLNELAFYLGIRIKISHDAKETARIVTD